MTANSFLRAFRKLRDPVGRSAVVARIERAETGNFGDYAPIDGGIYELRIDRGPGYRVYFGIREDELIILVILGTKRSQKADGSGGVMKRRKLHDFEELVLGELKDPKFAAAYLNEHLSYKGPKARELLLQALQNIAKARGLSELSRRSGISRRALYYAFSKVGNPTMDTFFALLDSIGVGIQFSPLKARKAA